MKKTIKRLSILTAVGIAISSACSMSADAMVNFKTDVPDGYELFEYNDIFVNDNETCQLFMNTEHNEYFAKLTSPRYNNLYITFKNEIVFSKIYKNYYEKLDFDYVYFGENSGEFFDMYDSNGNETFDKNAIPDKKKDIEAFCKELYEAGAIEEASYSRFIANINFGALPAIEDSNDFDYTLSVAIDDTPLENIRETVKIINDNYDVEDIEYTTKRFPDVIKTKRVIKGTKSVKENLDVIAKMREVYPETKVTFKLGFTESINTSNSSHINLLDPYICDIDGNGEADISDATLVLSDYAQKMAGVQTASNNNMDANGDGEVNIDDVTYILTYYAEASAGLR